MMIETQNCDFLADIMLELSARFQLENQCAPARLGLAQNLHSSGSLKLENSSSNSSLEIRSNFYRIDITSILEMR